MPHGGTARGYGVSPELIGVLTPSDSGLKPEGVGCVGIVVHALKRVAIEGELNPICE
jgi:hypothetical protein